MRIQRAVVVCVNREPQPGERIKAGIFTQSRRPLLWAGGKRRCLPRAVSEGTGQLPRGGTQGRVSRPSHLLSWVQRRQRCLSCPRTPEGPRHLRVPAAGSASRGVAKEGTAKGDRVRQAEEQDQWREEIASRQSRHAPADAASPPKRLLGVFPAPTIRRGCALTRELRSRSHSQGNGISLPILAPPSPFVSFLYPFQFCLHWMRYFGQQSFGKQCLHCAGRALSSPAALPRSGAVAAGTARGCGSSAPRSCSRRSCRTPAAPATPCWRSWTSPSDLELFAMFLHKT